MLCRIYHNNKHVRGITEIRHVVPYLVVLYVIYSFVVDDLGPSLSRGREVFKIF